MSLSKSVLKWLLFPVTLTQRLFQDFVTLMDGQFILLSSLYIFILPLAKLKSAILLQVCEVSHFCSQAHRSSLHTLLSEFMFTRKSDQNCFCCSFTLFMTEITCQYIYRKYLIWWVLHSSCGVGSSRATQIFLYFLPLQSLNWWINFLLLPSTFMTLVNFVSFCVSVLWCALFLLLPNVSLK